MGTGKDLWNELEARLCKKDWAGLASLYAEDAVHVDPVGRHEGRDAIGSYWEEFGAPFSDMSFPASLLIEQGDTVVAEYVFRATLTGALTMPDGRVVPPGPSEEIPCVTIIEVRDGKVVSQRDYFDLVMGMTQLGLMPGT